MRIHINDYDASWPGLFEDLKGELLKVSAFHSASIVHIGSTSVPGLAAKPVIDILVGIPADSLLDDLVQPLLDLSQGHHYIASFENVMPFRRLFVKVGGPGSEVYSIPAIIRNDAWKQIDVRHRISHMHCVHHDHPFFEEHIRFRDMLRNDDALRNNYEALKRELSKKEWESGAAYAEAKSDFIRDALQ